MESIRAENDRLKADVQRLAELLQQEERYKELKGKEDFEMSFLGKSASLCAEELEQWYPRELISKTERLLR